MDAEGSRTVGRCPSLGLSLVAAAFALLAAGVAAAQTGKAQVAPAMTAAELKASLFGIDMTGIELDNRMAWSECIDPAGKTLYHIPGGDLRGRLTISASGQACFSYEDDGYAVPQCFVTRRTKDGFRFEGGYGMVFVTTKVVRGVRTCDKDDLVG